MNAPARTRRVPVQKPGRSEQSYCTPTDFLDAVAERFGPLHFDLAATSDSCVVGAGDPRGGPAYFGPDHPDPKKRDALEQEWRKVLGRKLGWLNPPFAQLGPWAKKCAEEGAGGARILLLTPASVGSEWFAEHVEPYALVYFLRPRLCFDGKDPYPKDLMLSYFGTGVHGASTWRWKP